MLMRHFNRHTNHCDSAINDQTHQLQNSAYSNISIQNEAENEKTAFMFFVSLCCVIITLSTTEFNLKIYQWPNARPMPNGDLINYVTCKHVNARNARTHSSNASHKLHADGWRIKRNVWLFQCVRTNDVYGSALLMLSSCIFIFHFVHILCARGCFRIYFSVAFFFRFNWAHFNLAGLDVPLADKHNGIQSTVYTVKQRDWMPFDVSPVYIFNIHSLCN